ncbi:MAG: 30S ribosomal protein S15 [Hadesarchaea archaeon]|nr:30S ribosomal protein S15 [Hadesarchaea archaeon]
MANERRKRAGARISELSSREVEDLVVKLAKEDTPPSRIGIILRDQHAVPSIKEATGKSVKQILDANDIKPELPENLINKIRKAVDLYSHLDRNPKDFGSKRALEVIEAEINKLAKYYRQKGVLPPKWRYDRERAALLVRA